MKKIKKFLTLACAFMIVISAGSYTYAYNLIEDNAKANDEIDILIESKNPTNHIKALKLLEENGEVIQKDVYNEYDAYIDLKQLLEASTKSARVRSIDEKTLNKIENFEHTFQNKINYLNTLSNDQLKFINYNNDQIDAIRNFDGSPELMRRAATECTVYGGFAEWSSTSEKTECKLIAAFEWQGLYSEDSILANEDIFAVTWSSPFYSDVEKEEGYVIYKNENYGTSINKEYSTDAEGVYASSFTFDKSKTKHVGNNVVNHVVDSGSIVCPLDTYTEEPQIIGYAKYGKTTSRVTPGLSGNPDGMSMSISFTKHVANGGAARFRYPE